MSDTQYASQQPEVPGNEISLLDLLIVLAKHKKTIVGITFVFAIIAVVVALLMPIIYTAKAVMLPPQQSQSTASVILNQLGGLAGGFDIPGGSKASGELYIAMLQSRNVMEKVANRFNLQAVYGQNSLVGTLKELKGNLRANNSTKDGTITVEVDDQDPQRAASLANAFIEELDKLMRTYSLTDASRKRTFFEQQLRQTKNNLTDAELVLDKTPNTSLHYMDAVRNLKYQESMWEILAKQFEMAKMDEAKDFPLIQVLDKATPPDKRSKPKRKIIVILSTLVGFTLAIAYSFFREWMGKAKSDPEYSGKIEILKILVSLRK